MMKYEIKTVREEENAAMQRVQDGLGHSRGKEVVVVIWGDEGGEN